MAEDKRYFALQTSEGNEDGVFTGAAPRQAALKAARRVVEPAEDETAAEENPTEIRLRERGTDDVHVYDAWTWSGEPQGGDPEWLPDTIVEANVSKKGVLSD